MFLFPFLYIYHLRLIKHLIQYFLSLQSSGKDINLLFLYLTSNILTNAFILDLLFLRNSKNKTYMIQLFRFMTYLWLFDLLYCKTQSYFSEPDNVEISSSIIISNKSIYFIDFKAQRFRTNLRS